MEDTLKTDLCRSIRAVIFTIGTFCLLVWLNVLAPDAALLTSNYTVSIPAAGTTAAYPVFLVVATALLLGLHVYLHALIDRWLAALGREPDELSAIGEVYHFQSQTAKRFFAALVYLISPITLLGATYKAMALPILGIPIATAAIATIFWTVWLLFRRFLAVRFYSLTIWRICFFVAFALSAIMFMIHHDLFIRPLSLFRANLSGMYLASLSLHRPDLRFANLRDAVLADLQLSDAQLRGTDLQGATLDNVVFIDSDLSKSILRDIRIYQTIFWRTDLQKADLTGAQLSQSIFAGTNATGATFDRARLTCIVFQDATQSFDGFLDFQSGCPRYFLDDDSVLYDRLGDMVSPTGRISSIESNGESTSSSLAGASFIKTRFVKSMLRGVDLGGSNFLGGLIRDSYIDDVRFSESNMTGVVFWRTRLFDAKFTKTRLVGSFWRQNFGADIDLTEAVLGGMTVAGSRLLIVNIGKNDADSVAEEELESTLASDDELRYETVWRSSVAAALQKGGSPFREDVGLEKALCESEAGRPSVCTVGDENIREMTTRRLIGLACNDRKLVPTTWLFGSGPTTMEQLRHRYFGSAVDRVLARDLDSLAPGDVFEEMVCPKAPIPRGATELARSLLSDDCGEARKWLSEEDRRCLEKVAQPGQ
jgi:uncharacterized protein YjbI with pentapeptide repeats